MKRSYHDEIAEWGWRIPFFIGCMIIPLIFVLRRSLQETEAFLQRKHRPDTREILSTIAKNWRIITAGTLLVAMTTTTFYFITVYTPTYGRAVLHLSARDSLLVTMLVGISNFIWLPIGGAISDRIGRLPVLMGITLLALLTTLPVMHWLTAAPDFTRMTLVLLWFSFFFGMYNGAMVLALTEVMPVYVRTVGFSLAFSLATAIFGGLTPYHFHRAGRDNGRQKLAGLVADVRRAMRPDRYRDALRTPGPRLPAGRNTPLK